MYPGYHQNVPGPVLCAQGINQNVPGTVVCTQGIIKMYPGLLCVSRVPTYQSMQGQKTTSMSNQSSTESQRLPVQTTVTTRRRNKLCQPSNPLYV